MADLVKDPDTNIWGRMAKPSRMSATETIENTRPPESDENARSVSEQLNKLMKGVEVKYDSC